MPTSSDATRAFPFLTGFSTKDRQVAERAFSQQEERRRKAEESRARKADAVAEDLRRQVHDLVGAKQLAELRATIQRERLAFADLWQPPVDPDRDYDKSKQASKRRVNALLHELGASPEKLRQIGTEFRERMEEVLSAVDGTVASGYHLPKHLDTWTGLSPLHTLPLPWGTPAPAADPSDPHRWSLFRPPFFGFLFRFDHQASANFRVDRLLFLNPSAGLVGNETTMDCDDAGDSDHAAITAEAQIAVGFQAPAAGLVEVLIDAQSTIGTHQLEIEDEFGISSADCAQQNFLMMNVLHPNVPEPSLARMSTLSRASLGDDIRVTRENLTRGQHYFAHLFSSGPVPARQSVVVTAGTRTSDHASTNDMEIHSRTNFQWFINSVEIRIAP
jgi:hypothetical protein